MLSCDTHSVYTAVQLEEMCLGKNLLNNFEFVITMSTDSLAAGVLGILYKVTLISNIIEYFAFSYCISILSIMIVAISLNN